VVHLNELWDKYKDKGVVVVMVTNEPRALVDAFVTKNSPKYPIVIESGDSIEKLEGNAFPTQVMIGPDGKIIADGFSEQAIADYLPKQRIPPKMPDKLASAYQKFMDKDKLADARKMLVDVAAGKGADDEKTAADGMVKWIDEGGASALASAAETDTKGDPAGAAEIYEDLVKSYAGLDAGPKAADALKALLADPAKKKEIDASKALAKARVDAAGEHTAKKKIAIFQAVVKAWKDTKAGVKAAAILDKLEHPKK
jgi:hypothetical protein